MFCKNCGQEIAEGATVCPNCNTPVAAATANTAQPQAPQQPYAQQTPPQQPYAQQPYAPYNPGFSNVAPPKPALTWLIVNIVCVVLCGFSNILGIIGIVFGALAQSAYNKGNYAEAESKAKTAKVLGIITLIGTIILYIFAIISVALGIGLAAAGY